MVIEHAIDICLQFRRRKKLTTQATDFCSTEKTPQGSITRDENESNSDERSSNDSDSDFGWEMNYGELDISD